jgi:hypothetical protein
MLVRRPVRQGAILPVKSDDPSIEELQRAVAELQRAEVPSATLDFEATAAGPMNVKHGLGRVPLGWTVTDLSAAVLIHRVSQDTVTIGLYASGACTGKVMVF